MGKNLEKIWGESKSQGNESRRAFLHTKVTKLFRLLYITLSEQPTLRKTPLLYQIRNLLCYGSSVRLQITVS